jgi:two-component system, NtrC family, nitrogen regulation sensor histidine kinase NtrY
MDAPATLTASPLGAPARQAFVRWVEIAVLALGLAVPLASWWIISRGANSVVLLTPPLVALMLVANLLPGMALLVLLGRRIAMRRAAASPIGGEGRLHVRLVALFSAVAAVPTLLVVIFASLLFQYGVEFWFSDRARGVLENSYAIARYVYQTEVDHYTRETLTMRDDLRGYLRLVPMESREFQEGYAVQVLRRELSESMIVQVAPGQPARRLIMVNPYERNDIERLITPALVAKLRAGAPAVLIPERDRIGLLTVFDARAGSYLYAARVFDPQINAQLRRSERVVSDYRTLIGRSRSLQLQFNAALLLISLLIVGIAVWVALAVADRLVRPVGELVAAARAVAEGDLSARVRQPRRRDEIGTLARAFNAMTGQLETQTGALVAANDQLESRRALIEAVMSGVSAGVISIDRARQVRLINDSAEALLAVQGGAVGRPLAALSPELDALLDGDAREAVVQIVVRGEARTLAVKVASANAGPILTFDDITQQLLDQRRAAWADVARRIAHEIKNPLTPIQLAAERLQRRYGKSVPADDGTFARLTETIVRQVGDLRRMVDEFSSFARMPKPVFRDESLLDIARQVMFLHEVAHGAIAFRLQYDEPPPVMRCDRRQLGQALTNLVKNAVEAIEAKNDNGEKLVEMRLDETPGAITITIADSGVGLPIERDRIVEPYMTTRARGTGLGLAIVKKIVEEHGGAMTFADRSEGGTIVTLAFDTVALAALACGTPEQPCVAEEATPPQLTRLRK